MINLKLIHNFQRKAILRAARRGESLCPFRTKWARKIVKFRRNLSAVPARSLAIHAKIPTLSKSEISRQLAERFGVPSETVRHHLKNLW